MLSIQKNPQHIVFPILREFAIALKVYGKKQECTVLTANNSWEGGSFHGRLLLPKLSKKELSYFILLPSLYVD